MSSRSIGHVCLLLLVCLYHAEGNRALAAADSADAQQQRWRPSQGGFSRPGRDGADAQQQPQPEQQPPWMQQAAQQPRGARNRNRGGGGDNGGGGGGDGADGMAGMGGGGGRGRAARNEGSPGNGGWGSIMGARGGGPPQQRQQPEPQAQAQPAVQVTPAPNGNRGWSSWPGARGAGGQPQQQMEPLQQAQMPPRGRIGGVGNRGQPRGGRGGLNQGLNGQDPTSSLTGQSTGGFSSPDRGGNRNQPDTPTTSATPQVFNQNPGRGGRGNQGVGSSGQGNRGGLGGQSSAVPTQGGFEGQRARGRPSLSPLIGDTAQYGRISKRPITLSGNAGTLAKGIGRRGNAAAAAQGLAQAVDRGQGDAAAQAVASAAASGGDAVAVGEAVAEATRRQPRVGPYVLRRSADLAVNSGHTLGFARSMSNAFVYARRNRYLPQFTTSVADAIAAGGAPTRYAYGQAIATAIAQGGDSQAAVAEATASAFCAGGSTASAWSSAYAVALSQDSRGCLVLNQARAIARARCGPGVSQADSRTQSTSTVLGFCGLFGIVPGLNAGWSGSDVASNAAGGGVANANGWGNTGGSWGK